VLVNTPIQGTAADIARKAKGDFEPAVRHDGEGRLLAAMTACADRKTTKSHEEALAHIAELGQQAKELQHTQLDSAIHLQIRALDALQDTPDDSLHVVLLTDKDGDAVTAQARALPRLGEKVEALRHISRKTSWSTSSLWARSTRIRTMRANSRPDQRS